MSSQDLNPKAKPLNPTPQTLCKAYRRVTKCNGIFSAILWESYGRPYGSEGGLGSRVWGAITLMFGSLDPLGCLSFHPWSFPRVSCTHAAAVLLSTKP